MNEIERHVREAHRLRAEATADLLGAVARRIAATCRQMVRAVRHGIAGSDVPGAAAR